MKLKETKNKILDNPFSQDDIDLIIDAGLNEKVSLGKESNYYYRLPEAADIYMRNLMPIKGDWKFDYVHSTYNILYHNDIIEGNNGGLGCIIPIRSSAECPKTIMLKHWDTRRLMYCGNDKCEYVDTKEKADFNCSELEVDLVFNWETDKMLIFDVTQLHTSNKFENSSKTFLLGFLV